MERKVKIIRVSLDPEVKVICGAEWMDGRRKAWSGDLDRHEGETKMRSTLMVKIGLNQETRDNLSGS